MSRIVHCPHCNQALDITHVAPLSVVWCPRCRVNLEVPDSRHGASTTPEPNFTFRANPPGRSSRRRRKSSLAPLLLCLVGVTVLTGVGAIAVLRKHPQANSDRALDPSKQVASGPVVRESPIVRGSRTPHAQSGEADPADHARHPSASRPREAAAPATPAGATNSGVDERLAAQETNHAAELADESPMAASEPAPGPSQPQSSDSQAVSAAGASQDTGQPEDYPLDVTPSFEKPRPQETRLTPQERQRLTLENRIRRAVQPRFHKQRREKGLNPGLPQEDDHFVVAMYEMPLETQVAELRFEISQGVEDSIEKVVNYLLSTPSTCVRDFQVVARFGTHEEAETGIAVARQRYDQAKQYQEQLLAYLQEQQIRARALRRC